MTYLVRGESKLAEEAGQSYGSSNSEWLSIDWRKYLKQVEVDGHTINFVDVSLGKNLKEPPLLFIHGLSGCWQNWLENIPHFAKTRRVIALDLPGFGKSEMPAEAISMRGYSNALRGLLEALQIDQVDVVGNSMGGLISIDLTIEHPKRVRTLTLISSAGMYATSLGRLPRVPGRRPMRFFGSHVNRSRLEIATRARLRRALLRGLTYYPNQLSAEIIYEIIGGTGSAGFYGALQGVFSHDLRHRLGQIEVPTLIVWGRNDRIVPVSSAARFKQFIPHAELVILEQTGHLAMLERPATFNQLLGAFLARGHPVIPGICKMSENQAGRGRNEPE